MVMLDGDVIPMLRLLLMTWFIGMEWDGLMDGSFVLQKRGAVAASSVGWVYGATCIRLVLA
jgi:hypothetical protein